MMHGVSNFEYNQENPFKKWWNTRSFLQKRIIRFWLSILVLLLCIPLYDAGVFGTVDGPLHPSRIGDSLAGLGITKTHSAVFFLSLLIIAVAWNWVFNLVSYLTGARLTCNKADEEGNVCGARVERRRIVQKKTGQSLPQYVCQHGHKRPDAHFHPVQKGMISHTIWAIAACFSFIVLFLS